MLPLLALAGCGQDGGAGSSRFNVENRLNPVAALENATMSDSSVHLNPQLLRPGVPREQIVAAFGPPNAVRDEAGQRVDVYGFNPDGTKFVEPQTYARNVAAGVASHGIATAIRRARIENAREEVTYYLLTYGPDGRVQTVRRQ